MNIPTLEQFPLFEGNSYIFPTHQRELCQEGIIGPCDVMLTTECGVVNKNWRTWSDFYQTCVFMVFVP